MDFDNGVFIEAGANNGLNQSNTAYFELHRGWSGLLVEPSIDGYLNCLKSRRKSVTVNAALTSFKNANSQLYGSFDGGLMNESHSLFTLNGFLGYFFENARRPINALALQTLIDALDLNEVDFFSLDVEGYELEVLQGLDFRLTKIRYILVELRGHNYQSVKALLERNGYRLLKNMTNFTLKQNPNWTGHNDFLFEFS